MSLEHTKESLLFGIIVTIAVVGLITYIQDFIVSLNGSDIKGAVIDTLLYLWVIFLLFCKDITFTQRSLGLIIPIWILSISLALDSGIRGMDLLWLFAAPTLAGILLGFKEGVITLLLTVAALLLTALLIHHTDLWETLPFLPWSATSGNSIALGTLIMLTASVMPMGLNRVFKRIDKKLKAIALTEDATIETIAILAEYRDKDIGEHHERTKQYVRIIAEELSQLTEYRDILTPEYIALLYKSAQLHDIGKIGVPDSILLKSGELTPEEREIMEAHTIYGRDALLRSKKILGQNNFLDLAAQIAYTHQERWDGSGYPQGLRGEEIPLSGRIMAVADVYDALRSRRVYKAPVTHEEAISYLQEKSGVFFDPRIIALLPELESKFLETATAPKG
ncbi:HD-GYP domain-containing protein [Sulfurovum mangrovi]|uniref:HD-GYP domain-containing protein n=1 Tax=Sulfurovum mangrovi TaxID=2893889 RepID=UPI001E30CD7E|nr:HD domain-containing phosphohydrolase [Sulfurovum mangrovi]UFH60359.1 HD domain-containing protein [Sulfurovum mangrovi]